jgi:hypothetical protein
MRDRERGSVLPLVLGGVMLLAVLAYGGATVWRMVLARGEAQRAADAACLTAANVMKHLGMPFNLEKQGQAEALARANTSVPLAFEWQWQETPTEIVFQCLARAAVPAPRLLWSDGVVSVTARARGSARQQRITEAEKRYPQLVLVLDYSGSMQRSFDGSMDDDRSNDSYWDLIDAANALLDKGYEFRYGVVIYASDVLDSTSHVRLGNLDAVKDKVNKRQPCPYDGQDGCMTGTWLALDRARELLADPALPEGEGKFVLFVSDGEPSGGSGDPKAKSVAAANGLWDLGAEIFSIQITNSRQSSTTLREFMHSVSGTPEKRGVPDGHYWNADNPELLEALFEQFANALACQLPVVEPAPTNPSQMHVFVRDAAGNETALADAREAVPSPATTIGDLWDSRKPFKSGSYFYYDAEKKRIYVTPGVGTRILDQKEPVFVRFRSPLLR